MSIPHHHYHGQRRLALIAGTRRVVHNLKRTVKRAFADIRDGIRETRLTAARKQTPRVLLAGNLGLSGKGPADIYKGIAARQVLSRTFAGMKKQETPETPDAS